jgi:hypothetical protein
MSNGNDYNSDGDVGVSRRMVTPVGSHGVVEMLANGPRFTFPEAGCEVAAGCSAERPSHFTGNTPEEFRDWAIKGLKKRIQRVQSGQQDLFQKLVDIPFPT